MMNSFKNQEKLYPIYLENFPKKQIVIDISGVHSCILKVGVEESIVNAPLVSLQSKNTNNAKCEVRVKQLIHGAIKIDSSRLLRG
jgi:hypothetical protein